MSRTREFLCMAGALSLCLAAGALAGPGGTGPLAARTPRGIAPPTRIPDPVEAGPAGVPLATAGIPRAIRRAVVADAARRFAVAESAVVLSAAEEVTWSDASLGCPEPGRHYAQMRVPGYRLSATTAAGTLRYHTDTRGNVVTCAAAVPAR